MDGPTAGGLAALMARRAQRDLLRFITCGSVDDGKSTLLGRLLVDAGQVPSDTLARAEAASRRWGTRGDETDLALLLDGLHSEREQGITIDVAYRYFSTPERQFICADTPGHAQYTRNMATAASTADLAVVLIDATKGVLPQTRRHAAIAAVMGVGTFVAAVNKMDLVDFDEAVFADHASRFSDALDRLGVHGDVVAIPLCAVTGDNVVRASERAPWYSGPTLLGALESARPGHGADDDRHAAERFRFPVQYVIHPGPGFRGYAGTIESGSLTRGAEVLVLPSRTRTRVARIVTADGDLDVASAPSSVTVTLEDDLDVARGDMLAHPTSAPSVTNAVDADLVWLGERPVRAGAGYVVKLATRSTVAVVNAVEDRLDLDALERQPVDELALNEIGGCSLSFTERVVVDPYRQYRATGSFVLIDRLSNATVAAGMVRRIGRTADSPRATNLTWQTTQVTRSQRAAQKGQRPTVLWFTGLSGAGKSTIASALEQRLFMRGHHCYVLDGDNVRFGLNRDLGFDEDGRIENIRRVAEVAKLMADAGLIVMTAFISPFRGDRQLARDLFEPGEFIEVFVDTPLEVAEHRDVKGLYAKARKGLITNFTGIDSPYERPEAPEVHLVTPQVDATDASNDQSDLLARHVETIIDELARRGRID